MAVPAVLLHDRKDRLFVVRHLGGIAEGGKIRNSAGRKRICIGEDNRSGRFRYERLRLFVEKKAVEASRAQCCVAA